MDHGSPSMIVFVYPLRGGGKVPTLGEGPSLAGGFCEGGAVKDPWGRSTSGGTHPTGMRSCLFTQSLCVLNREWGNIL